MSGAVKYRTLNKSGTLLKCMVTHKKHLTNISCKEKYLRIIIVFKVRYGTSNN